jgi:tRNA(Ile)-lysidine synthase
METESTPFLTAVAAGLPPAGFWSHPVLVGVSGGGDSVALLLALARLAPQVASGRLVVVHADHDLRPSAARDRAFTERLAASLRLPVVCRRLAVQAAANSRGEGLEARARRLRYAFFTDVAADIGARHVAVAHTADDQAETILHRLLRGTGLRGLAGMSAARQFAPGVSLVRPLLAVPRREVRGFLAATGQEWCEDETNADTTRARNFLRHEILARCEQAHYPAATASIARLAGQAARTAAVLADAADHLLAAHSSRAADGTVVLQAAAFAGRSPDLLSEMGAALWRREGWPQRDMTARHYRSLAQLVATAAAGGSGQSLAVDFPGGLHVAAGPGRTIEFRPPGQRRLPPCISTRR